MWPVGFEKKVFVKGPVIVKERVVIRQANDGSRVIEKVKESKQEPSTNYVIASNKTDYPQVLSINEMEEYRERNWMLGYSLGTRKENLFDLGYQFEKIGFKASLLVVPPVKNLCGFFGVFIKF